MKRMLLPCAAALLVSSGWAQTPVPAPAPTKEEPPKPAPLNLRLDDAGRYARETARPADAAKGLPELGAGAASLPKSDPAPRRSPYPEDANPGR